MLDGKNLDCEKLQVFCLENGEYLQKNNSQLLPDIDLELLVSYLDWDEPFDAIWDFKAKIRSKEEERRKK